MSADTILELIKAGGPLFGPLLFVVTFFITASFYSLQRQGDIRDYRLYMALVDKDVFTVDELRNKYGVLPQTSQRLTGWEGVF